MELIPYYKQGMDGKAIVKRYAEMWALEFGISVTTQKVRFVNKAFLLTR